MEHPAFAEAGQSGGLEIWTIDQFEPVPIESKMYGKFYNGDAYIVLKTNDSSPLSHDIHYWLGSLASQDKRGAAAILTVTLGDALGARAVHHREAQGHEGARFLGYFKPAIRYLEGGLESGFREVETNAGAERRLLQLSGAEHTRIETVPPEVGSICRDHCYILEYGTEVLVWMSETARASHRRRVIQLATSIRDEHNGRASIEIIDEFSPEEDVDHFFEVLGSGSKEDLDDVTSIETPPRDGTTVYLYRVLAGEELQLEAQTTPFNQQDLESDGIYILDTPDCGLFIWIGSEVNADVKRTYHEIVQSYLDLKGYPPWVHATRISEGAESSLFKQFSDSWECGDHDFIKAYAESIDAGYSSSAEGEARLVGRSAAAPRFMPDEGGGGYTVLRFSPDVEDITSELTAEVVRLYSTEVYLVVYQSGDRQVLYCWMGSESSDEDKMAAYEKISELENEFDDDVTVVRIPQGKEPKHFLRIFKGTLAVLFGGRDNDYAPDNANHDYETTNVRLFRVTGTRLHVDTRALQVAETAASLHDDTVCALQTCHAVYLWIGKESDEEEQQAALQFVSTLVTEREVVTVHQGDEPAEFWDHLGGTAGAGGTRGSWRAALARRVLAPCWLVAVSVTRRGRVVFEEIPDYTQEDLSEDGAYILDTGEELYYWRGRQLAQRVKAMTWDIIEEYTSDDGLGRAGGGALVVAAPSRAEPSAFTARFPRWDPAMWDNQQSYEDLKREVKSSNSQ